LPSWRWRRSRSPFFGCLPRSRTPTLRAHAPTSKGGYDLVVGGSYFVIPVIGGLAAAAVYTESRPNRDNAIGYGVIGVAASYVVGVTYFLAGLCGFQ
jgi:hypothetical protein